MNSKMWKGKSAKLRTLVLVSSSLGGEKQGKRNRGILRKCSDRHVKVFFSLALSLHFLLANDKHQQREKGERREGKKCNDECNFPQKMDGNSVSQCASCRQFATLQRISTEDYYTYSQNCGFL